MTKDERILETKNGICFNENETHYAICYKKNRIVEVEGTRARTYLEIHVSRIGRAAQEMQGRI